MSSYSEIPSANDGPDLRPPSYDELTAARAREYGFALEVLRPTTTPYPPSAPYPISSQDTGQMPMPMPVPLPMPVPVPLPVPVPVVKTNSLNFTEESATSRRQRSRVPAVPPRDYQRIGTTAEQSARTPTVRHNTELVSKRVEPDSDLSACCVYIIIILLVGSLALLGFALRNR